MSRAENFAPRIPAAVRRSARRLMAPVTGRVKRELLRVLENDSRSIQNAMIRRAADSSAEYLEEHMLPGVPMLDGKYGMLAASLSAAPSDGLLMEFGVWKGKTINFIADRVGDRPVYGFDSFEGLPEDWHYHEKARAGAFAVSELPSVRANVTLVPGWYDETLESFLEQHAEPVAFLHIDCDLYSSTKTVFDALADRMRPGTVIHFDEYLNYPGWQHGEFKAWQELVDELGIDYEYLGWSSPWATQVAVKIRAIGRN